MRYDLTNLPYDRLLDPVAAASAALVRLDERLRGSAVQQGWIARTDFADAQGSLWLDSELVHMEDLVLHDARMDIHTPSHALTIAHSVLRTRRRIARHKPGRACDTGPGLLPSAEMDTVVPDMAAFDTASDSGVAPAGATGAEPAGSESRREGQGGEASEQADPMDSYICELDAVLARSEALLSGTPIAAPRNPLLYDADWDEEERFADWQSLRRATRPLPPVLRAALLLDGWNKLQVVQHSPWLGRLLVGDFLRAELDLFHLPALNVGLRQVRVEQRTSRNRTKRLLASLDGFMLAAEAGLKQHDTLLLAKQQLDHRLGPRRQSSHLPRLIPLVLSSPLITTEMIAQSLAITQRSALRLVNQLALREMTGRGRYRAWGV